MRRAVLHLPGLVGDAGDESFVRGLPFLSQLAERGRVFRLGKLPEGGMIEAAMLGLDPRDARMEQGPLTVAALGFDPPPRSVHAHLSLLSVVDGVVAASPWRIPEAVVAAVFELAERLRTKRLTPLRGEGAEHGLVIENGSLDIGWTSAADVAGKPYAACLPEGDDERLLRQFIDDSVNLLSEQEFNRVRIEEGLPPANLLWPWGFGWRADVPNLGLRTGEVGLVLSGSLRLQGLTRLAHWKHGERAIVGQGTATAFEAVLGAIESRPLTITLLEPFTEFRAANKPEELDWLAHELDRRLLAPLAEWLAEPFMRVAVLCPNAAGGLGLIVESGPNTDAGRFPFDERILDDPRVPTLDLADAVRRAILPWNRGIG